MPRSVTKVQNSRRLSHAQGSLQDCNPEQLRLLAFVFVGITSLLAEATDTHPQLGHGIAGFGRHYGRSIVDKTDGNYLVDFALPTILHEDERYYTRGEGEFWKRSIYAASRTDRRSARS